MNDRQYDLIIEAGEMIGNREPRRERRRSLTR